MLAGVTDCRSWKWGCKGKLALGFKPRHGSQARGNHVALAEWGPRGIDTADGAGSLNHGLLLFLRYGTPDWAKGRGKDCTFVGILKNFSILMKTLSHYSKSV